MFQQGEQSIHAFEFNGQMSQSRARLNLRWIEEEKAAGNRQVFQRRLRMEDVPSDITFAVRVDERHPEFLHASSKLIDRLLENVRCPIRAQYVQTRHVDRQQLIDDLRDLFVLQPKRVDAVLSNELRQIRLYPEIGLPRNVEMDNERFDQRLEPKRVSVKERLDQLCRREMLKDEREQFVGQVEQFRGHGHLQRRRKTHARE